MDKLIISSNGGGLGNRIKGLISIIRLGKYFKRKPLLHWPKNVLMGCNFTDLFDYKIKELNDSELDELKKEGFAFYREWLDNTNVKERIILFQCWRFIMLPKEIPYGFAKEYPTIKKNNIDFEFERIPLEIKKEILKEIKKLKPKKDILNIVNKFNKRYKINYAVGLHVRRTDFQNSPDGRANISTDDDFFKKMHEIIKEDKKVKFFLCTDALETEKQYKKEFGNRIITYPKKNWNMSSFEASRDSLIDLLLLSRTKRIFGTYLSTFSEVAWWFGNCQPKIEIIGNEKSSEKKKVIENLNKENFGIKGIYKKLLILKKNFNGLWN